MKMSYGAGFFFCFFEKIKTIQNKNSVLCFFRKKLARAGTTRTRLFARQKDVAEAELCRDG